MSEEALRKEIVKLRAGNVARHVGRRGRVQYDELLELAKSRRTIRVIKPDPVPDESIEKALEVARWAPSGFNMQPAEFLVLKDPDSRSAVKQIVDDWIDSDFYALEATREAWQGPAWTLREPGTGGLSAGPGVHPHPGRHPPAGGSADERAVLHAEGRFHLRVLSVERVHVSVAWPSIVWGWRRSRCRRSRTSGCRDWSSISSGCRSSSTSTRCSPSGTAGWRGIRRPSSCGTSTKWSTWVARRDDEFLSDEELRKQIRKLRMGNVARHGRRTEPRSERRPVSGRRRATQGVAAMAYEFRFPDVGEGITEGELLSWKVKEGDQVAQDQTLAEMETDKAVVEMPSPRRRTRAEAARGRRGHRQRRRRSGDHRRGGGAGGPRRRPPARSAAAPAPAPAPPRPAAAAPPTPGRRTGAPCPTRDRSSASSKRRPKRKKRRRAGRNRRRRTPEEAGRSSPCPRSGRSPGNSAST